MGAVKPAIIIVRGFLAGMLYLFARVCRWNICYLNERLMNELMDCYISHFKFSVKNIVTFDEK